ncbi:unnamed protein product [Mytilus coruscus]|uniref:Integrase catalytic domain-containing protein n=1 Tax=Mytilus coruscus TaxID=42192 RepID=A0A6J8E4V4_MYTCO|nr:unnamed protein product [Mytilus coruscus]
MRKPMLTSNEVPIQVIKDNKKESTESLTLDQVAKLIDEKLSQLKTGTENRNGYYQNRPPRFNNRGRGSESKLSFFAFCKIDEIDVKFLVDTGSPVSLISFDTFEKLKLSSQLISLDSILTTANGNALSVKGKCILNIAIGPLLVKQEVIVVDIKGSSGILGMNFFEQNEIDIQIKSQCLSINGQSIPLFKENSSQCSRIHKARQVSIPANREMIIEASKRDSFLDDIGIIEPLDWVKSKGLLVAKSLVDTENTIYLAIMNLNSKSVKLKQGEQIAHLMTIEQVFDEDNTESQIDSKSDDISEQVNTLKDIDMPEHLKSMLDKVSSDLKDEEKQKLSSLIHEYEDIFVGPDGSLGRTDRVKHYIDTSDAKPVKISPRRVALKQRDVLEEELKKMIDKNLIEPSCSPWAAPTLFIWPKKFTLRTDHASLKWLKNFKNPEGMIARWISIIDTYDMEIQHRKGSLHTDADGLSRTPKRKCKRINCPECTKMKTDIEYFENVKTTDCIDDLNTVKDGHASCLSIQSVINSFDGDADSVRGCLATHLAIRPVNVNPEEISFDITSNWLSYWSNSQLREMQENDQNISFILNSLLQSDEKPKKSEIQNKSKETKILYGLWESLTIQNNLLCKFFERENQGLVYQFVAPEQIRNFIFQQLHCTKYSAHFGRDKTLDLIKKRFYWPNMSDSIKLWINSCDICAKGKPGPGKGKSPLKSSVSTYPLDRIAIDIIGPLPITTGGNEYIMVVEDYFTKWTESYAIPNHQALTVADKLVTEFICRSGCPFQIHTDQGREFESDLFAAIRDKLGIDKTRTCPYRPQSDGMVEQANKKLGLGWTGPYKVIKKITDLTYRIQKDTSAKQLVVHVDHLKPYQTAHTPTVQEQTVTPQENVQTLPPPVTSRFGRVIKPRQILTLMELQLHMCDNEYKSFQNDHLRELWPAVGAYCNIEECGKTQFFRSFNEYKSHFGSIHKETLTLYTCQICDLSRRKLQILKKHLVKDHKCSQNRYRVGDANERKEAQQTREKVDERKRKAKEDAQETRKRYVESGKKPHVEDKLFVNVLNFSLLQIINMYTEKDHHVYPDRSDKLLGEKGTDCVVDLKSNGGKKTKNHQQQICVWIKKWKWKFLFGFIALCSIVSVALSLYKMWDLSLDEKEISSMKTDILEMKHHRKKFENDIKLLFAGHYDQNEKLDTLETVLQNITVTFNERINNLTTQLNTLTTKYQRQVRLQEDMQKQIDAMGMENRKKFEEFDQKIIAMKQNLNNMTAAQEALKKDLRDTRSSLHRGNTKRNRQTTE